MLGVLQSVFTEITVDFAAENVGVNRKRAIHCIPETSQKVPSLKKRQYLLEKPQIVLTFLLIYKIGLPFSKGYM